MDIPDIALKILARLPLKSIARFRSVKKEWKFLIDSDYFRDYFISLNSSSSTSWSIVQIKPHKLTLDIVSHHGCKVLGLTRPPGSLVSFFLETKIRQVLVLACTDGLVLIYAKSSNGTLMYYIGNPLLQEWFRIPLPSYIIQMDLGKNSEHFKDVGLVTEIKSGMVVSYKIVVLVAYSAQFEFMIYSSDSGIWELRNVACRHRFSLGFIQRKSIALNGILHWLYTCMLTSFIVAYNFYGGYNDGVDNDKCRSIGFPGSGKNERFKRTFTTSEGFIVYLNEFYGNENRTLRVWRLVKYTDVVAEAWQLFWEVNLVSLMKLGIDYFPVVMHPLNSEIIYLWSRNKKSLILYNLRTHLFSLHKEFEVDSKCMDGCVLSFNDCSKYMETIYEYISSVQGGPSHLLFSQYVLPRWLHRLPPPPPQPSNDYIAVLRCYIR
ncbi:putative F-box protein [Cardamine amara subsp. amara]|uniref:F-box protein n=1 Tax=Cardamine amara subsp. amara TaxID=228776 RepID=A0ABD0ZSX3_CARAN